MEISCVPAAIRERESPPGSGSATFATKLGILAVRGFGDMGKRTSVWECHSERESSSDASRDRDSLGESDESRNVGCLQTKLQDLLAGSDMSS